MEKVYGYYEKVPSEDSHRVCSVLWHKITATNYGVWVN